MDVVCRNVLRSETAYVSQNLLLTAELEAHLIEKSIFTPDMLNDIKRSGARDAVCLQLLCRLEQRGPEAFYGFCQALQHADFPFVAERLLQKESLQRLAEESQDETRNAIESVLADNRHVTAAEKERLCDNLTTAKAYIRLAAALEEERVSVKDLRSEIVRVEANMERSKRQLEAAREERAALEAREPEVRVVRETSQLQELKDTNKELRGKVEQLERDTMEQKIEIKVRADALAEVQGRSRDLGDVLARSDADLAAARLEADHLRTTNRELNDKIKRLSSEGSRPGSGRQQTKLSLRLTRMNCRLEQHTGRRLVDETTIVELVALLEENVVAVSKYIDFLKGEVLQANTKLDLLQQQNIAFGNLLSRYRQDEELAAEVEGFMWMSAQESSHVEHRMRALQDQLHLSERTEILLKDKLAQLKRARSRASTRASNSSFRPPTKLTPLPVATISGTSRPGGDLTKPEGDLVISRTVKHSLTSAREPKGRRVSLTGVHSPEMRESRRHTLRSPTRLDGFASDEKAFGPGGIRLKPISKRPSMS